MRRSHPEAKRAHRHARAVCTHLARRSVGDIDARLGQTQTQQRWRVTSDGARDTVRDIVYLRRSAVVNGRLVVVVATGM
jgi:hypothetical protein